MILNGNQRGGGLKLAAHLMNARDNDHVEVHELRGFTAETLHGAFQEADAISKGTKCQQYLFSLSINPPETERVGPQLTRDYGDDLETDISAEVQEEFLVALWSILVIVADLHINLGPTPDSSNRKINNNHTHKPLDVVSLLTSEDTAPETAAPRSINNEKE